MLLSELLKEDELDCDEDGGAAPARSGIGKFRAALTRTLTVEGMMIAFAQCLFLTRVSLLRASVPIDL